MAAEGAEQERRTKRRRSWRDTASRRPRGAKLARDFYGSALDAAERIQFEAASDIEGLDYEIALLRMKLRETLEKRRQDLPLMLRGMALLVKAVSARYRLSKQAEEDLAGSIAGVVRGAGGLLIPEAFEDE